MSYGNRYKQHSKEFIVEAIKGNIEDNTSFRAIANRQEVVSSTVLRWVNRVGEDCKVSFEASLRRRPVLSGILDLDGKPIKIAGQKKTAFLAVDFRTKDLVHLF